MTFGETTNQFTSAGCHDRQPSMAALAVRGGLCLLIQLYRFTLSPLLAVLFGPDNGCRFTPTCSRYAMDAIREHGALAGSFMAAKRLCRCHPFGECGHDPVPPALPKIERRPHTC
jgi:putative membrane protein insertion efficiency factor